jgi:hypothetical protein
VAEPVAPQVVALLAGLAQALVAELVLGLVLAPGLERTLQEVQAAQCQAPLAKVPTQEWAAEAPRAPARPIPAQAQIPKSAGSSLECGPPSGASQTSSDRWRISQATLAPTARTPTGPRSEHYGNCPICGALVDMRDLPQVFAHMHGEVPLVLTGRPDPEVQ